MTPPRTHERANDVYERLTDLADEASWYREQQQASAERAQTLRWATWGVPWINRRLLLKTAVAQERYATVAGRLAEQLETGRQALLDNLPQFPVVVESFDSDETDLITELEMKLHDAEVRVAEASRAADDHFEQSLTATWPWQRRSREEHWLRSRYFEACAATHSRTIGLLRAEIDMLIREQRR